jgi:hypothetical protein
MFSDDVLFGKLVLKGGNAISLIYKYGARGSLDVHFSIEGEFEDAGDAARRITRALTDRFDAAGFIVFDCTFGPRPLMRSADNPKCRVAVGMYTYRKAPSLVGESALNTGHLKENSYWEDDGIYTIVFPYRLIDPWVSRSEDQYPNR